MLANMYPQTSKSKQHNLWIVAIIALIAAAVLPVAARFSTPAAPVLESAKVDFDKLPLSFEPNEGQTDPSVRFMAHASGGTMYFTPSEVVLSLPSPQEKAPERIGAPREVSTVDEVAPAPSVLRLQFLGANPDATIEGREQLPGKVNYFIGNDPSKWHTDLPTYSTAYYGNLYPGIDLEYEGTGGRLKGTYTVAPDADPSLIQWRYEGAQSAHIDEAGNMQVVLSGDGGITVTEKAPVAWQEIGGEQVGVKVAYNLAPDNRASFVPASYDHTYPLIIDPTLTYSTYLGGSGLDTVGGIAVDASGNAYVTGFTTSTNFPLQNPFQPILSGFSDAFVTKFSSTGSTLIYSTYLGGSSSDEGDGIAVDASGNAYVAGSTSSTNFPLQDPFQPTFGGGADAFVTKLSSTGAALLYSTYLGGSGLDISYGGIAIDASGNAYVAGYTASTNFPLQNPFQSTNRGYEDAFVTKFSSTGSTLIYSTYLGGSLWDRVVDIAVDSSGNAYVTGRVESSDFPLQNPFQPTNANPFDAFVTKFSSTGSTLIYSTYLGGSLNDEGWGIAADASGNAYVTGSTSSEDFPLQDPFQPILSGNRDAFVTKFSSTGSTLIYSTYLGGSLNDEGRGIAVDASGNAYVTGWTSSANFPSQDPFQPTFGGFIDAFVTKFRSTGTALYYSSHLGGSGYDRGDGIAVDSSGNAYVTGETDSTNFPLQNPFQPIYGGSVRDAFVAKINDQSVSTPTATSVPPTNTPMPVTNTPAPPSGTPVPPTATSAPPTATQASTSTTIPPTSTAEPPTSTSVPPTLTQPPATATATATVSPEPCTITFTDVPDTNTFYANIRCLACRGIISGYSDGTFKPNNLVTRGQLAKIVSNAANFTEDPNPQIFEDVPPANTFYQWINRLARRGHMSGYACGGVGEPCTTGMPYFRPFANATRGQTSKIVSNAAGYSEIPTDQTFEDVPPAHTFYNEIQRLATRNIMQGYPCGGPGEPCLSGKPYFRPGNDVTRGQSAKIVANTFYPNCQTPANR